jgi:deazaflavin-dependent oxidoreductase (nitroreductase family)
MRDVTARRLSRLHRGIYRLTRGRVGKRLVRNDMLLLTTTGARSGKPHTVPLLYLRDGDTLVVIASWGGRPYHPDWYHNLLAHPVATVRVRSRTWDVRARTAGAEERDVWWPRVLAAYHGYREYQSHTDRVIPVVFLEPTTTSTTAAVQAELLEREPLFHREEPPTREVFDAMMDPGFVHVGASGRRRGRAEVLDALEERYRTSFEEDWDEIVEPDCRHLGGSAYLLTYTLVQGDRITRRASIWDRSSGRWRVVYHQGTPVPDP